MPSGIDIHAWYIHVYANRLLHIHVYTMYIHSIQIHSISYAFLCISYVFLCISYVFLCFFQAKDSVYTSMIMVYCTTWHVHQRFWVPAAAAPCALLARLNAALLLPAWMLLTSSCYSNKIHHVKHKQVYWPRPRRRRGPARWRLPPPPPPARRRARNRRHTRVCEGGLELVLGVGLGLGEILVMGLGLGDVVALVDDLGGGGGGLVLALVDLDR